MPAGLSLPRPRLSTILGCAHQPAMGRKIVIAGAGSIGCFVGGLLARGGERVTLLARLRVVDEIGTHGLHLTSYEGWEERIAPDVLNLQTSPDAAFADADLVLVTVKSGQTAEIAELIRRHAPAEACVISLQNGLDNAAQLRERLPHHAAFAGMVSFNVLGRGDGRFHRGTSGPLVIEAGSPPLAAPHLDILHHPRMNEVLAGKLVYNLNNALNALSGLTLREQLRQRQWRLLLADCQQEALRVLRAKGIRPWSLGAIPITLFPRLLRLPDFLFRRLASRGVRIDADARSSMWEDLERGRPTEVGELQGKVVALAAELGLAAPANAMVLKAVRSAEKNGPGSPRLSPKMVRDHAS
jgi:2-dehydropantoate 2-reductase